MFKKSISCTLVLLSTFFVSNIFAQSAGGSAAVANRRTAIRYMQLAKQYASEKQWSEADSNAKIGLAYDDSIADLWYLRAVSQMNNGGKKSEILPLVMKALNDGEWVDYNKDGSRILYADILCSTHQYEQALKVLDSKPFIYSSDAEYIRARSYYNLKTDENLEKARLKIDAARRVYPTDTRFAELFYQFEYKFLLENDAFDPKMQKIADAFLAALPAYGKANPELELYAAIFVQNEEKRSRILKAFSAKGLKSPLYPVMALKAGLMNEHAALDYFYSFSDGSVHLEILEAFAKQLVSEEARLEFGEYLNSYNGTLLIDSDGDLITNLMVNYNRGRPEQVFYDENQDDEFEWTAECDFGVPVKLHLTENSLDVYYVTWPYVQSAVYKIPSSDVDMTFNLIAETLAWSPFSVAPDAAVKDFVGSDFYVPQLSPAGFRNVSGDELVKAALGYSMPSKEKKDAVISVSLLNGFAQIATYSVGEKVYAVAKFENGLPVLRTVDMDDDGLFETTEEYGYTKDLSKKYISKADEMQIMTNLFGNPAAGTGIYIKSIKIDRTGDTNPNFIEEYTAGEGKISTWDVDSDGKWDVRYVKLPSMVDGKLREEAQFYQPLTGNIVTVASENGIPVSVKDGEKFLEIIKGSSRNFYWISVSGLKATEEKIIKEINQTADQGVCIIVEDKKERYLAVRVENKIFAELLPSEKGKN